MLIEFRTSDTFSDDLLDTATYRSGPAETFENFLKISAQYSIGGEPGVAMIGGRDSDV